MEKQDYQAFGIAELGKLAPQLCGAAAKYAEKSKCFLLPNFVGFSLVPTFPMTEEKENGGKNLAFLTSR